MSREEARLIRRLLIVDRYDAPALQEVHRRSEAGTEWHVLLLGLSPAWFRWQHAPATGPAGGPHLVDLRSLADAANELVGRFLVDLVERLPDQDLAGGTLGDLLHDEREPLWWYLEITEKGPYRGPLVAWLYRLALVRLAIDAGRYDEIRVSLSDQALAGVLEKNAARLPRAVFQNAPSVPPSRWWDERPYVRYWTHAGAMLANLLLVKAFLATSRLRAERPAPDGLWAFTFYPAWWGRPFGPEASDRFFSHLRAAGLSGYFAWLDSPRALWAHRREARDALRANRLRPLQASVTIREALDLLRPARFGRIRRFERRMRPALRAEFAGFEVGPLVASDVSASLTSGEPFQDTLISRAVRRAVAAESPRTVLYRLEFQPAENALLSGLAGRATGVGFLHYPFGRNYLSMRFAPGEVDRCLRRARRHRDRPMPDGVVACGAAGVDHFAESGYPRARLVECGPQRYGRLLEYRRAKRSRSELRPRLGLPAEGPVYFIALAIAQEDTEALFGALAEATRTGGAWHAVVRTHPNRPQGDPALRAAIEALGSARLSRMHPAHDLYDHLSAADAVVCIGSMLAFEAMALGTMPIVFENPGSFGALSLAEFENGLFVARDGCELAAAFDAVRGDTDPARARRARWPDVLGRVLGDLDTPLPRQLEQALFRLAKPALETRVDA